MENKYLLADHDFHICNKFADHYFHVLLRFPISECCLIDLLGPTNYCFHLMELCLFNEHSKGNIHFTKINISTLPKCIFFWKYLCYHQTILMLRVPKDVFQRAIYYAFFSFSFYVCCFGSFFLPTKSLFRNKKI